MFDFSLFVKPIRNIAVFLVRVLSQFGSEITIDFIRDFGAEVRKVLVFPIAPDTRTLFSGD
jgi:hypothetical protein